MTKKTKLTKEQIELAKAELGDAVKWIKGEKREEQDINRINQLIQGDD